MFLYDGQVTEQGSAALAAVLAAGAQLYTVLHVWILCAANLGSWSTCAWAALLSGSACALCYAALASLQALTMQNAPGMTDAEAEGSHALA